MANPWDSLSSKEWDALVALETLLGGVTEFGDVGIGYVEDLFHKDKFGGKIPAVMIEYRGENESGAQDSSFERYVPVMVTVCVMLKAPSVKLNRRDKVMAAIYYKNLVKNKVDSDPQLGGLQVEVSPARAVRILSQSERVPTPYWLIEVDVAMAVWEDKANR
jgi:hypothetical protein